MRAEFSITGMTCENCVKRIEDELNKVPGVNRVLVNLSSARAVIEYDESKADNDRLQSAITDAGYDASVAGEIADQETKSTA